MTIVGGNPESTLRFQTHVMSNLVHDEISELNSSMLFVVLLAILTLTPIVHLRRGKPVKDSQSGPLDDDQLFCLLAILMLFIGRVLRWRQLVKDSRTDLIHADTQPLRGV